MKISQDSGSEVLTRDEVAKYCNVTPRTISNWMARGWLKPIQQPGRVRFHVDDVRAFWTGRAVAQK